MTNANTPYVTWDCRFDRHAECDGIWTESDGRVNVMVKNCRCDCHEKDEVK